MKGISLLPAAALAGFVGLASADPKSDLFQPDAFGTAKALQRRTEGLADPLGRSCALPSGPLSLPLAVDLALCRNPATRASWATAREQAAALGSAESAWLPSIQATGSLSRYNGPHADATGNIVSETQNTRDAAATLSWTLYDFGGRTSKIRSAHRLLDAAAANVNANVQQTTFVVVRAFYGVVAADATLVAATTTESTAQKSLEIARALRSGGVATLADALQAETVYDQAVINRVQAQAQAKSARGSLAFVIGAPADQPFKLEAEAVPAQVPGLSTRMSDLMEEAKRQRPELAAALAQRDAAQSNVTAARALGRPSISIQAGRSIADTTGVPNQSYNQIGVYVTVPIFSGFNAGYGIRQAQGALEMSEANADQVALQVSLDVWNAYYALEAANEQLTATATLTKTAEQNQDVAFGRYQSGVGTILDVLTAQNAAANARQQRINAELAWQTARSQLWLALGRLSGAEPLNSGTALP